MDFQRQISQAFWQGMVKLIILHQANLGPVYGGRLSKYFHSLGYGISPGSLYPCCIAWKRPTSCAATSGSSRGGRANIMSLLPKGKTAWRPRAGMRKKLSGR